MRNKVARPFVKWVGGKTQLLNDIKRILPADLSPYICGAICGWWGRVVLDITTVFQYRKGCN